MEESHYLKDIELQVQAGRATKSDYVRVKKAALLAGIELCNTKSERLEIRREIVNLYIELEELNKRRVEAGLMPDTRKARINRLEAEIDLLKEQLK